MGSGVNVLVIDYGMGNLGSVRRAFEECGATVTVSSNPDDLARADRIVLPGVGAFPEGIGQLRAAGWPAPLNEALKNPAVSLLGICLGMQLLATLGHEGETTPGLGIIPGEVVRLTPEDPSERIPHVGWNEVHVSRSNPLTAGIADGTDFYFVHSYRFVAKDASHVFATSPYCGCFPSIVGRENVMGTQFHPEKSSKPGFQIIRNFLRPVPC